MGLREEGDGYPLLERQVSSGIRPIVFGELDFGAELTLQLTTFGSRYNAYELRGGGFGAVALSDHAVLGEVGETLVFTQVEHAQFGTFDLRAGGGVGLFDGEVAPHVVVTATGGIRSFRNRYEPRRPAIAFGSVLRLFLTSRIRPTVDVPVEAVFGLEVEPTFLLPPWSWMKLAGARPD